MKKNMGYLVLVLFLVLVMMVGTIGCSSKNTTNESAATDEAKTQEVNQEANQEANNNPLKGMAVKNDGTPLRIGYIANELVSEWMTVNTNFTKSLIERAGGQVTIFNADGNTAKEISALEDMIQSKPDAIILHPTSSTAVVPGVEKANKAGIPCFSVDIPVNGGDITTHVGLSQERLGYLAGERMVKYFEGKSVKVLEIFGQLGAGLAEPRDNGFKQAIEGHDNIKIVASHVCDWRNELSMNATMDAIQKDPDINAIFIHSDCMLEGTIQALAQMNRLFPRDDKRHIYIASIDGSAQGLENIRKGYVDSITEHNSALHADIMVKVLITKLVLGKDVPKRVEIEPKLITVENVDDPQNWGNLPANKYDEWPVFDHNLFPMPKK